MAWFRTLRARPWWIVSASVGGLLVAIALAGLVGLAINRSVKRVTDRALHYDVELEDNGDNLRVAVLDLRHYHRNLFFVGPSRGGLEEFDNTYRQLHEAIDDLDRLGVDDPQVPPPEQLRAMAEEYYATFRPAVERYASDHEAFVSASDNGLVQLERLERAAQDIDRLGEQHAAAALTRVEAASRTATLVQIASLGGLVLVGAAFAYTVVRMVEEVRRLYAEQQETARQLARALQAKTDFIADASHELRTPLTVLRGNAEVGLTLDRTCVHGEIFEEIVKGAERMSRLVEDLLYLARSDAMALPLEPETITVASLLAGLAEPAEVLARQQGTSFQAALGGEGWLRVDAARIEQVVLILVDNAAKYSPPGGRVTLTSSTRARELAIAVADRGPGIPAAELPLIFERFYRVDKARARKQGGTGLGLAIAKTIAEAHGGRITAASRVNAGTTMTLHLPLSAAARSQSPPAVHAGDPLALGHSR